MYNIPQSIKRPIKKEVSTPILTTTRSLFQVPQMDFEYNMKKLREWQHKIEQKERKENG
jgi:hypothetical protein